MSCNANTSTSCTWIQLSLQFPPTDHSLHPSHLQSYAPPSPKSELGQLPIWLCSHHCSSPTFPSPHKAHLRWRRQSCVEIATGRLEFRDMWPWREPVWSFVVLAAPEIDGLGHRGATVLIEMLWEGNVLHVKESSKRSASFFHLVEQAALLMGGEGRARRWWSWGRRWGRGVMERLLVIDDSSDSITLSWLAKVYELVFHSDLKWLHGGRRISRLDWFLWLEAWILSMKSA